MQADYSVEMKRFINKVAIVTGSSYGIGFAAAKRLAQEGAKVVISSRNQVNVQRAVDELKRENLDVIGIKCHVGEEADRKGLFDATISKYGKLNILVSNAAVNPAVMPTLECGESAWDKIFNVNVKAAFMLAKEAVPHIRKEGPGGNIVFVSSIVGLDPIGLIGAYSASKTALIGLTKAIGKDLAKEGIRVNCLAPGLVATRFLAGVKQHIDDTMLASIPMGRLGRPEELAGVIAFLASDDASFVTCETVLAAGGKPARF